MKFSNQILNLYNSSAFNTATMLAPVICVTAMTLGCGSSSPIATESESPDVPAVVDNTPSEPELRYPVPKGTADDLATFLTEMATRDPVGSNPDESTTDLAEIMMSRRHAAEKLLALPDAEPIFKLMASEAKLESLRTLSLIGKAEPSEFVEVANELAQSNDTSIAQVGRIGKLHHALDEVRTLGVVETDQLLATIREITASVDGNEHPDLRVLYSLSETGQLLQEFDEGETAVEVLQIGAGLLNNTTGDTKSTLDILTRFAHSLEGVGELESAGNLIDVLKANFSDHSDEILKSSAVATAQQFEKRFANIGQPLEISGTVADGEKFDADSVKNKVVLLQFWSSASRLTEPKITELQKLHRRHHEGGFQVVGVCLDDAATMSAFLADKEIPWPNLQADGKPDPNAAKYGVDASIAPYAILANASGKIVQINPSSDDLKQTVVELLANIEKPKADKGDEEDVEETATADDDKKTASAPGKSSDDEDSDLKKNGVEKQRDVIAFRARRPIYLALAHPDKDAAESEQGATAVDAVIAEVADRNPYLPDADLSTLELVDFILEMKDKTRSIQLREGFSAGVVEASERVLQANTKDRFHVIAALARFQYLHRDATTGDEAATVALHKAVDELANDSRPAIAREVAFLSAEREVLKYEDASAEEVKPHIDAAISYFESADDLADKHLRMASATVGLINKIDDGKEREEYFAKLGEHLAGSSDKAVARYGARIAKRSPDGASPSALVGKPLEITGETVDGDPFAWDQYRGKIVLVDFWATWCGPCRAIMPKIEELHEAECKRGFDVVGISLDQDLDQLSDFLGEHKVPWTLLAGDGASDLADKYNVRGIPMLMLVDADGKVVATGHSLATVTKDLDTLLSQLGDKS